MRSIIRLIKKTYKMAAPHEGRVALHNAAFLSKLQAITYLIPLLVLPYLFRTIGPEKFGLVSFAQAFIQYFLILTDYGFSVSATKEISLHRHDKIKIYKIYSSVMSIKVILALLSLMAAGALVYFIPKFRMDWMVYVFSLGVLVGNTLFPAWLFQGMEKMQYIADLNIIGEFVYAFLIFFFVQGPQDYLMVPVINSAVFLMTGIVGQYIVVRKFGVSFKIPQYKKIRQELVAGWNVFISIVAINAYTTTRIFAVGLLTNNTFTGFYSIAEKIANVAQTFPLSSFSLAIFPRLSKIFHKNKARAFVLMRQIQLITVKISLIGLPVIFLFAPLVIKLVCGGTYPETVLSLRLLLIAVFFVSANAFRVQFLLVCGKTKAYSTIHLTMAVIGLPLIIALIYYFSYAGAALATIFIEAGIFTMTYFTVKKLTFTKTTK